jgi:TPR repeat protein
MSYTIDIVVPPVPAQDALAWRFAESLRAREIDGAARAPVLARLHGAVTAVYPCLSSYASDDPRLDDCPWSDGPLINNFGSAIACLGLVGDERCEQVVRYVVACARTLGLTVLDPQQGVVHRPIAPSPLTWNVVVDGILPGFDKDEVVAALAVLFKCDAAQVRKLFDATPAYVKKGQDLLTALVFQARLEQAGCACTFGPEQAKAPSTGPASGPAIGVAAELARLRAAAEAGDAQSQFRLGYLLKFGEGVERDPEQAVQWYEKAAAQGHSDAQIGLACCYRDGVGVFKSYEHAFEWMGKAAAQGDVLGQCGLGLAYLHGQGVRPDPARAVQYLRQAAAGGELEARRVLGRVLYFGKGVAPDYAEAATWLRQAAEQGDCDSQYLLGCMYGRGDGVPQDAAEKVRWYREAARQGQAAAQFNLAMCHESGSGVERDVGESVAWLRKSVEGGFLDAHVRLAQRYRDGEGVPQDSAQALALLRKAASGGNADGQYELAQMYFNSEDELSMEDRRQALHWLNAAAAQGHERATAIVSAARGGRR